jgi:hypothetical protein
MKNTTTNFLILSLLTASVSIFSSCKKDKEEPQKPKEEDHEIITSLVLTFTDAGGNLPGSLVFAFRDPDGPGGNAPTQHDVITLPAGVGPLLCSIQVLNESENPAEDLTPEIIAEGDEHLFCFDVNGANVSIVRIDSDGSMEIGQLSEWTTGTAGNGTVKIRLKHYDSGKNENCTGGETDIEVTFQVEVL